MKKMLSKFKHHKRFLLGFCIIFIAILIRLMFVLFINCRVTQNMEYKEDAPQIKYILNETDYITYYKPLNFFTNDCFLYTSSKNDTIFYLDDSGKLITDHLQITVYMWPLEPKRKYGVFFYECSDDVYTNEQVYIDKYGKILLTNEYDIDSIKKVEKLLEDNNEYVVYLLNKLTRQYHGEGE